MAEKASNGMGGHYETFVRRFMAQDEKISCLEKAVNLITPTIERLDNEFFNHDGGEGLKTIVLKHIAAEDQRHITEKEFHDKRDTEIKTALAISGQRQNLWMLVLTVLILFCAVGTLYIGYREYLRKSSFEEPKTGVNYSQPVDASVHEH